MTDLWIERFEAGALSKEEWTHAAHLRMAAWYVEHFDPEEAAVRIRRGIRRLNECMGNQNTDSSGFHETLTEFWIRIVRTHAGEDVTTLPAGLWKEYYSVNLPKDRESRLRFVEPDLKPIEALPLGRGRQ